MNIVMFTPALRSSAIGRMACLVTRALQGAGHRVVIVRAEQESMLNEPTHGFLAELVAWTDSGRVQQLVAAADLLVYQVGDNYTLHRGCLEWLPHAPGVVCLHDYFVGHLFWGWAQHHRDEAIATLRAWYGEPVAASFFAHPDSESFIEATHNAAPLTEWISAMASGVITHSSWGIDRVLQACPGPVSVVPLPYTAPTPPANIRADAADNTFHVLTVGHVNPNKRVASVIRAIGNSELLRQQTVYRVVGRIMPATVVALSTLARNSQVNLLISDEVEDPVLASAFEEADVITCLRFPSLEAASASAIEAMLYGKPVIVTDVNFYSEIPDGCVVKIAQDNELEALQAALETLFQDAGERKALGERGQHWAQATFTAENYARQLVGFSRPLASVAPAVAAAHYFQSVIASWGGSADMLNAEHSIDPLRIFDGATPP